MFKDLIKENKDNIINLTSKLISFPSVSEETQNPDMPFGKACKDVLEYTLEEAKKMGFRTKNIDGFCGYIEFGEGKELVGIIGHLDVVPANVEDGWNSSPFEAVIKDNKLYGRGAIDDKGPVVSSLYAMKFIMDNCKVNKRVRLILGLNEEKDWKCIERYKQTEETPSIGFSPDANFPAIYAEKGILSLEIKNDFSLDNFEILETDCKGNALNVVPKYVSITLKNIPPNTTKFENDENIEVKKLDKDTIKIISTGVASHAAHPELGKNAITNLAKYLLKYFKNDYLQKLLNLGIFDTESPEFLCRKDIAYPTEFEDESVIQDESGILTSNVARFDYENGKLSIKINLRVPVKTSLNDIIFQYRKLSNLFEDIEIKVLSKKEPLYVDKNGFLVTKLVDIFNKATCTKRDPIAIGGGTYARAFPNFIAYGPTMPYTEDMCHQVNEFIEVKSLLLATEIYSEAIYELAK